MRRWLRQHRRADDAGMSLTTCTAPHVDAPWFLSLHALGRMDEMNLLRSQVVGALRNPDTDYPSRGSARRIATRGPLAVVYEPEERLVVTVLWNGQSSRSEGPRHERIEAQAC